MARHTHILPILVILVILVILLSGCRNKVTSSDKQAAHSRYVSGFPTGNLSGAIEAVTRSVKKIYSVSSYETYQFRREDRITPYHLQLGYFKQKAWGIISTNETVFGTATVIGSQKPKVALLTCAHVVTSPDTLISYFDPATGETTHYIQRISIKTKQENWVKDLGDCGSFNVIAADESADIAILGNTCDGITDTIPQLTSPAGQASDLGWGNFVYILGYPLGNQTITSGIVSPSPKRPSGEFSVDALLNKGYSGGIILAIHTGLLNFELVGMVITVSSSVDEYLKPSSDGAATPEWIPYTGNVYVAKNNNIQYGLNEVVPMESIREFYAKNRAGIVTAGYNLDEFFQLH